jgi:hypothetical protein
MTQIGLDPHSFGTPASDDHCADVRGPGAGYVIERVMRRKFVGQTSAKIVRLSDVYRIPSVVRCLMAEDINTGNDVERDRADFEVLKFVGRSADPRPK